MCTRIGTFRYKDKIYTKKVKGNLRREEPENGKMRKCFQLKVELRLPLERSQKV